MAGVINEASGVCYLIGKIVSRIYNIKEVWVTAPSDYQDQVEILRARLGNYGKKVGFHEQPVDGPVTKTLKSAESKVKRVEERLQKVSDSMASDKCCSQMCGVFAKVRSVLFPDNSEKTIKEVIQDLESIPKILEDEKKLSGLILEASRNQAISTIIRNNDSKYVLITKSQEEVIKAVEDADGCPMILLYGGFGEGKSTLARYISHSYGEFGENSNLFDHVVVVSCGDSFVTDLSTKQYEILEHLSPMSLTDEDSESAVQLVHCLAMVIFIAIKDQLRTGLHNRNSGDRGESIDNTRD